MNLEIIHSLRLIIVMIFAYIATISFAGWFEAWIAKQVGDYVPEQNGFLTFNPGKHFSIIGFGLLAMSTLLGKYLPILAGFPGFGQRVPIAPAALMGPHAKLRVLIDFLGRSIGHFILTLVSFIVMVAFLKMNFFHTLSPMAVSEGTSLIESLRLIMLFLFQQNSTLFIIYFVIGLVLAIIHFFLPEWQVFSAENTIKTMFMMIIGIMLLSPFLNNFLFSLLAVLENVLLKI